MIQKPYKLSRKQWFLIGTIAGAIWLGTIVGVGSLFTVLWNLTLPAIFGVPTISILQGIALWIFIGLMLTVLRVTLK
jgi:hypothetical protein